MGFSAKLTKEEKTRIRTILQEHVTGEEGIIVRTNARETSPEELTEELFRLRDRYEELKHRAMSGCVIPFWRKECQNLFGSFRESILGTWRKL